MSKMKIAVTGAAGRMGRELVRTVHGRQDCVRRRRHRAGRVDRAGPGRRPAGRVWASSASSSPTIRSSCSPRSTPCSISRSPRPPSSSPGLAANARIVHVFGTTGLTPEDDAKIAAAARHATIITLGQHEPRRQSADRADAQGRRGARRRLRHRDRGDAPPPQGRCAVGHSADAGQGRRRRSRRGPRQGRARAGATATPARAAAATSALPRCEAAAWSAITP
mgnify:CR=1 FL=1